MRANKNTLGRLLYIVLSSWMVVFRLASPSVPTRFCLTNFFRPRFQNSDRFLGVEGMYCAMDGQSRRFRQGKTRTHKFIRKIKAIKFLSFCRYTCTQRYLQVLVRTWAPKCTFLELIVSDSPSVCVIRRSGSARDLLIRPGLPTIVLRIACRSSSVKISSRTHNLIRLLWFSDNLDSSSLSAILMWLCGWYCCFDGGF